MRKYTWPTITFVAICLMGWGARQAIGRVYGAAEAQVLLEAISRAGLYLGSAIATASTTTLALMLTLIGMIRRMDQDFDQDMYNSVTLIARLATAALMLSLVVLMAYTLPIGEFEQLPTDWYATMYEALFASTIVMVALLAAMVAVVYQTLYHVIASITPGEDA
ncbi:hypothetical protein CP97_10685 [Aurantiacibacter atlanticus]|uniref:Uncharacterized protein n=1 Tax=Aurantiacibacter atlanticus TaxID=1648404 RepID=A0A0H4VCI6_9SPHN|nr:hypothetical protein [Aurantiacibacter atlanticus]AKQ42392.1 hypothetical protein CP97_10685 [Aurantiacibacter atlanticus]